MIGASHSSRWIVVVALLLGGACGSKGSDSGPDDTGADSSTVAIKDDFFTPEKVAIAAGDKVVWTWEGNDPHNVHAEEFESKIQTKGEFSHTFERAGTFDYSCTVHPNMTASVVVTAS